MSTSLTPNGAGKRPEISLLEEQLYAAGSVLFPCSDDPTDFYRRFVTSAVEAAQLFIERGIPVSGRRYELEYLGTAIGAVAKFPSGREHPILEFVPKARVFCQSSDTSSAYTLLCAIIRTSTIPPWDRIEARSIVSKVDEKGYLEKKYLGKVKVLEDADVKFAKEVIRDAFFREFLTKLAHPTKHIYNPVTFSH